MQDLKIERLQDENDRLKRTFSIIGCNNWEWDIANSTLLLVNNTHDEMIDYLEDILPQQDGLITNFPQVLADVSLIPDKYSKIVRDHCERIFKGKLTGPFKFEMPFKNKQGITAWIRIQGYVYTDCWGKPSYALGSYNEFTERRRERMKSRLDQRILKSLRSSSLLNLEADLTADLLEEGPVVSGCKLAPDGKTPLYSDFILNIVGDDVVDEHRAQYRKFVDRDRLMQLYVSGSTMDSLDYLRKSDDTWIRLTVHLDLLEDVEKIIAYFFFISIDESASYRAEIAKMARTDALTGLLNRHSFTPLVDDYFEEPDGRESALLLVDVDDFKMINDQLGHKVGDEVLKHIARKLQEQFPPREFYVSRYGGDEFVCLLKDCSEQEAKNRIDQLVLKMRDSVLIEGTEVKFSISAGYALSPRDGTTPERLYELADMAMFAAKNSGKNTARAFSPSMEESLNQRLSLNLRSMMAGLPGGVIVFSADKNESILFASTQAVELFGCENVSQFNRFCEGSFANLIEPGERSKLLTGLAQTFSKKKRAKDQTAQISFKARNLSGNPKLLQVYSRRISDNELGDLIYCFVTAVEN